MLNGKSGGEAVLSEEKEERAGGGAACRRKSCRSGGGGAELCGENEEGEELGEKWLSVAVEPLGVTIYGRCWDRGRGFTVPTIAVTAVQLEEIVRRNRAQLRGAVPQETAALNPTCGSCAADPARYRGAPRVACQAHSNACRT